MNGKWLVPVSLVMALIVAPDDAAAKKKRPVCGGTFLVHERPLLLNPAIAVDRVNVQAESRFVSVESGCQLFAHARLKGTKKGITKVKARWVKCSGITGRVKLKGKIDRTCHTFTGKIRAPRAKFKRKFVATVTACGDGIYYPEGGEQCDAGRGCGRGQECKANCTCGAPGTGNGGPGDGSGNGGNGGGNGGSTTTTVPGGGGSTTTTTLPAPDLAISVPIVPNFAGQAGQSVEFTWTVTNVGTLLARAPWNDAVYISLDDTFGSGDLKLVDFRQIRSLIPGESYSTTADLQLPFLEPGTYYLLARTDDKNVVPEPNELNNEQAVVFEVTAPDLEPTKLDPQPKDGCMLQMKWQVRNKGDGIAYPPWHEVLYSSTDDVLDASDVEVATFDQLTPLGAGDVTTDRTATFPNPPAGTYIILVVDGDDFLFEGDETNNVRDARELHDGRCP